MNVQQEHQHEQSDVNAGKIRNQAEPEAQGNRNENHYGRHAAPEHGQHLLYWSWKKHIYTSLQQIRQSDLLVRNEHFK